MARKRSAVVVKLYKVESAIARDELPSMATLRSAEEKKALTAKSALPTFFILRRSVAPGDREEATGVFLQGLVYALHLCSWKRRQKPVSRDIRLRVQGHIEVAHLIVYIVLSQIIRRASGIFLRRDNSYLL